DAHDYNDDDPNYNDDDDANPADSHANPHPTNLPVPAAQARADFLRADVDPSADLPAPPSHGPASRHQPTRDLRAALRDRGAAARAELVEPVNARYAEFLSLGAGLGEQGGADRAADVRVALMGFRRAVEELRARVRERRAEVGR